uniref:hypothetical protein n=1 Tax=Streptomyces sp. TRM49041 TaxID=2603216 RepID=UPI001CA46A2E
MSSIQVSRYTAPVTAHPLRRVTDWPAAPGFRCRGHEARDRHGAHPARRASDRVARAAAAHRTACR